MGEYAPDDQRTVHKNDNGNWQNQEDGQQRQGSTPTPKDKDSQMGYGNARDTDGQMEQQEAPADEVGSAQPRETSANPAERAHADANRPLDGGR